MRFSRRSGAELASVSVGKVELLGRGYWHPPAPKNLTRRVIAVGSMGGCVGKSTVAAHLAVAMANLGAHVIAVDMDLRSPRLHTLFGLERPASGLQALFDDEIENLDSSLARTRVRNLQLLTGGRPGGGTGNPGAAPLDGDQKQILLHEIDALESDVIVLDLGGISQDDLADAFAFSAASLLVAAPRPASLLATFDFLGLAARRAAGPISSDHFVTDASRGFTGRLVGNLTASSEDVESFHAFSRLVQTQLGLSLPIAACVRNDGRLTESGSPGRSPLVGGRLTESGRAFHGLAEALLHEELCAPPSVTAREPAGPPMTEEMLVSILEQHRRKHVRHEVDWSATLHLGERLVAVRVADISMSGAALEVVSEVRLGELGTLLFDQLPGRPALSVVVKSLDEPLRRGGVAFTGAAELRQRVVATAAAQRATGL